MQKLQKRLYLYWGHKILCSSITKGQGGQLTPGAAAEGAQKIPTKTILYGFSAFCFQSFDTVGWASRRVSGLYRFSDEVLVWLSEVQIVCIWSSLCHCIPKPHHLLLHLSPDTGYIQYYSKCSKCRPQAQISIFHLHSSVYYCRMTQN